MSMSTSTPQAPGLLYVTPEEYRKLRIANIHRQLPMARVLLHYGVELRHPDPHQETSYACPLHGDGNDSSPSARLYPDTQSTYCFACQRARDAVGWVREKEGLPFWAAIRRLEDLFNLEPLPSHVAMLRDGAGVSDEGDSRKPAVNALETQLQSYLREEAPDARAPDLTGAEERARLKLVMLTRDLPPAKRARAWSVWWAARAQAELSPEDSGPKAQATLAALFLKLSQPAPAPSAGAEAAPSGQGSQE